MAIRVANNKSLSAITALPSGVSGGAMNLLETQTASSSSTLSFTSNIDSTYDEYQFHWIDCHPSATDPSFTFQADTGTNTSYNQTMTTTYFQAKQKEDDSGSGLEYATGDDQAQATAFQRITGLVGSDNDQCASGEIFIYSPSSSTYVKHFMSKFSFCDRNDRMFNSFAAGYFNTTTALTRLQFKFHQGNIDAGTIKLYGIKDS